MISNLKKSTACSSFIGNKYPIISPYITSLSSNYSVVGSTTLLTLFGSNFRDFSVIRFGTTDIVTIFISSSQLSFYIPTSYSAGTYPIQVFNDNFGSNVMDFTIDDNGNFWQLSDFDFSIFNTNEGGVNMGKNSVNAKYFQSNSTPAVSLFTSENILYPIHRSITDFSNVYKIDNSDVTISKGNIIPLDLSSHNSSDITCVVSPGYKLTIKDSDNMVVLDIENLSTTAIRCKPHNSGKSLQSAEISFYFNHSWTLVS